MDNDKCDKNSLEYAENIINTVREPLFVLDQDLRVVSANCSFLNAFRLKAEETVGQRIYDLGKNQWDIPKLRELLEVIMPQQKALDNYKVEHYFNRIGRRIMLFNARQIERIEGRERIIVLAFEDITEREVAEEEKKILTDQLNQAQRMESIGIIAGGIAHDFNNILTVIFGNAELALHALSSENPVRQNIEAMIEASLQAKEHVDKILSFSRKEEAKLIPIHPQSLVAETLKLLRSTTPTTISIIQDISKDCGAIMTDISQFHRVIMNLFRNAVQAMNEKGTVTVSLKEVNLTSNDFSLFSKMSPRSMKNPGAFARLSVADTGTGINQKTLDHIFDPFFTTKKAGKGTGMGLSIVHDVVKSQGGFITVESEEGKGSAFSIFIPITLQEETLKGEESSLTQTGTERILLVDDEEILLDTAKQILEGLGYKVMSESSSNKALETFMASPDFFDLIVTDQSMPNLSGTELVAEILKVRPDMPIILSSGYSSKVSEENYKDAGVDVYLRKPYSRKILSETVRKVLDGNV